MGDYMDKEVKDLLDYDPEQITKDYFVDNSVHLLDGLLDRECKRYATYGKINSAEEFNSCMEYILRLMKDLDNMPFRAQDEHLIHDVFLHFIINVFKLKMMFERIDNMAVSLKNDFNSEIVQQKLKDIMVKLKGIVNIVNIVNKDYIK
jgi:hypothetical protein